MSKRAPSRNNVFVLNKLSGIAPLGFKQDFQHGRGQAGDMQAGDETFNTSEFRTLGFMVGRTTCVPSTTMMTREMDARNTPPSIAVAAHIA